jgi:galactonate dehydratase
MSRRRRLIVTGTVNNTPYAGTGIISDVEISGVETYLVANPWKPWVFVEVETDAGVTGIAEATTHDKPRTIAKAIDEMSNYFVGKDPFDTEQIWLEMYRDEWFSKGVVNTTVCSAVDMACWDIKGKLLDKPVYELLGGKVHGDRLRAYANGWYTDTDGEPEGFAEAAERVVDDGYDAMKFDPFGTAWQRMSKKDLNHSVDIVRAVREAVGPDVDLLIECHGRFTAGQAATSRSGTSPANTTANRSGSSSGEKSATRYPSTPTAGTSASGRPRTTPTTRRRPSTRDIRR